MKTTLITGATGTIGKATALELAKNNCHLILLGRNPEKPLLGEVCNFAAFKL